MKIWIRYYMLVRSKHWGPDTKKLCSVILDDSIKDPDKYQVGITKIFFRSGMVSLNKENIIYLSYILT